MQRYQVSCNCGTKLSIVLEQSNYVQIYCDRCHQLIFPQETQVISLPTETADQTESQSEIIFPGLDLLESCENKTVDNYRMIKRIGSGGMGTVYLADHLLTQEKIVLKVLRLDVEDEEQRTMMLEYFIREAQILMELDHPNIVKFKGCGNFQGKPYLAMEFIEGKDLKTILETGGPMKLSRAIFIIFRLATALEYAYNLTSENGKRLEHIHRDIKPSNVILNPDKKWIPKLIDFGLAKSLAEQRQITIRGVPLGTPFYMPKEQILNAKDADHRSDIYSLGATFYHMLCGQAPFQECAHAGNVSIMEAIVNGKLVPLKKYRSNLPDAIYNIISTMMASSRKDRYPTATHLKRDLKAFIEGLRK